MRPMTSCRALVPVVLALAAAAPAAHAGTTAPGCRSDRVFDVPVQRGSGPSRIVEVGVRTSLGKVKVTFAPSGYTVHLDLRSVTEGPVTLRLTLHTAKATVVRQTRVYVICAPDAQPAAVRTVHIRGTAYDFGNVKQRLSGARISVAENPSLSATTAADGTYDLAVPDHTRVTPFIVAPGFHSVYLQTFETDGEDLAEVNFQTPPDAVAAALASLLNVPVDSDGYPQGCVIVSTLSTKHVRGVPFQDFIAYGAHGVPGATATASPTLPAPTYFNASVIPDPAQMLSSKDGGVIWPIVPTGRYRLSATAPGTSFAPFDATCAPGRIVNASPPWGLHELATTVAGRVTAHWTATSTGATLDGLTAGGVPAKAHVTVACVGALPCFPTTDVRRGAKDLRAALGRNPVRLRTGRRLEVRITAPAFNTRVVRWDVRARTKPKARMLCIPLGDQAARTGC